jgi:hypothetical protein
MVSVREASDLDRLVVEQAGVLTTAQAGVPLGQNEVRRRVDRGIWRRICRGVVMTGNDRMTRDQQLWAAVLTAGPGAVLAGVTAAAEGGVRGLRAAPLQLLVPAKRMPSSRIGRLPEDMPRMRVYRTRMLPPEHRQTGPPARTTVARSVVDAAAWAASDNEARHVLVAACRQRLVRPAEVLDVLAGAPRIRRRALIRTTLADLEDGAQALSEIDLLVLCRRFGLPLPDQQAHRTDSQKRYIDGHWHQWNLLVRVDPAHHPEATSSAVLPRPGETGVEGDRVLRFPAFCIRDRSAEVAAQLRSALTAGGWR